MIKVIEKMRRCKCGKPIRNPTQNKSGLCSGCGTDASTKRCRDKKQFQKTTNNFITKQNL